MSKNNDIDPVNLEEINKLIKELKESRSKLTVYSDDLEKMYTKAMEIFPKKHDFRNKHLLDDKLKVLSSFYSTLLSIRQEINRQVVKEIEVRRNINKDTTTNDNEVDIRQLVNELDKKGFKLSKKDDSLDKEKEEKDINNE